MRRRRKVTRRAEPGAPIDTRILSFPGVPQGREGRHRSVKCQRSRFDKKRVPARGWSREIVVQLFGFSEKVDAIASRREGQAREGQASRARTIGQLGQT